MRRHQFTNACPESDTQQLHQALLLLNKSRCLNISAFCRQAIAEKLERLETLKLRPLAFACLMWKQVVCGVSDGKSPAPAHQT
jgi:hypothetical protein